MEFRDWLINEETALTDAYAAYLKNPNREAQNTFYAIVWSMARSYAYKNHMPDTDPEDFAQNATKRVMGYFFKNKPSPPAEKLLAWLYKIFKNEQMGISRKFLRRNTRLPRDPTYDLEEVPDRPSTDEREKQLQFVRKSLQSLPEPFRTTGIMFYQQGLTMQKIADRLQKPVGTIKTRLLKVRDLIKELMPNISEAVAELEEDPILGKRLYHITGNSYPIKQHLQDIGCEFDYRTKQWKIYNPSQLQISLLHKVGVIIPPQLLGEPIGKIELVQRNGRYILVGYTWPYKNFIKSLGFKWDSFTKKWYRNKITPRVIQQLESIGVII